MLLSKIMFGLYPFEHKRAHRVKTETITLPYSDVLEHAQLEMQI